MLTDKLLQLQCHKNYFPTNHLCPNHHRNVLKKKSFDLNTRTIHKDTRRATIKFLFDRKSARQCFPARISTWTALKHFTIRFRKLSIGCPFSAVMKKGQFHRGIESATRSSRAKIFENQLRGCPATAVPLIIFPLSHLSPVKRYSRLAIKAKIRKYSPPRVPSLGNCETHLPGKLGVDWSSFSRKQFRSLPSRGQGRRTRYIDWLSAIGLNKGLPLRRGWKTKREEQRLDAPPGSTLWLHIPAITICPKLNLFVPPGGNFIESGVGCTSAFGKKCGGFKQDLSTFMKRGFDGSNWRSYWFWIELWWEIRNGEISLF